MDPAQLAHDLPVLLAPGLYVVDDRLTGWLRHYVAAGGHLIVGPRGAYADQDACIRQQTQPAGLADLAGASYQELGNIAGPIPVEAADLRPGEAAQATMPRLVIPPGASATLLADGLLADSPGDVVARYVHPHFGRFAAITSHGVGDGRVTLVGTVPNPALAEALMRWAAAGRADPWRDLVRGSVTVMGATTKDGRRLHVVHNWSWDPVSVTVPAPVEDVVGPGVSIPPGGTVDLAAWDVRVLLEPR